MKTYTDKAMPFGKYKGELICEIETSYLHWLLDQDWFDKPQNKNLIETIEQELKYREQWGL